MTEYLIEVDAKPLGITYLIHFREPIAHARHYIGWTQNFDQRMEDHSHGKGKARLMEVVFARNIRWVVARTWHDTTRDFERKLKNRHATSRFCPMCIPHDLAMRRATRRVYD